MEIGVFFYIMSDCLKCKYYKSYFSYGVCSKGIPTHDNKSHMIFCPYYETDYWFILFYIFFWFSSAIILFYIVKFLLIILGLY